MAEFDKDKLRVLGEPLAQLLRQGANPYTMIVITQTAIKVLVDVQGLPLENDDRSAKQSSSSTSPCGDTDKSS